MKTLLLILLFPALSFGQSISIAPTSVDLWGSATNTVMVEAEYNGFQSLYFHSLKPLYDNEGLEYSGGYFGLFYGYSVGNKLKVRGSAGAFHRKFPTDNGTRVNFRLNVEYNFGRIGIGYSHLSNGFGLFNDWNPGIDNFYLKINL